MALNGYHNGLCHERWVSKSLRRGKKKNLEKELDGTSNVVYMKVQENLEILDVCCAKYQFGDGSMPMEFGEE